MTRITPSGRGNNTGRQQLMVGPPCLDADNEYQPTNIPSNTYFRFTLASSNTRSIRRGDGPTRVALRTLCEEAPAPAPLDTTRPIRSTLPGLPPSSGLAATRTPVRVRLASARN